MILTHKKSLREKSGKQKLKRIRPLNRLGIEINSRLLIPSKELRWRFSRSSGPGGQGVNTTDSRVELIFDIKRCCAIENSQKQRLIERLGNRCINNCLKIVAKEERSQYQNRQLALKRLRDLLREGLNPSKAARKATKPTGGSKKRRIKIKRHRSALKQSRQRKPVIND